MTVREIKAPDVPGMLGAIDAEARETMKDARNPVKDIVNQEAPRKTGELQKALAPRSAKTATGAKLAISVGKRRRHGKVTAAQVLRWTTRGTGENREGPGKKKKIKSKRRFGRMTLPGGKKVYSVKGQEPKHYMVKIEARATPVVERECREGAKKAARAAELAG